MRFPIYKSAGCMANTASAVTSTSSIPKESNSDLEIESRTVIVSTNRKIKLTAFLVEGRFKGPIPCEYSITFLPIIFAKAIILK